MEMKTLNVFPGEPIGRTVIAKAYGKDTPIVRIATYAKEVCKMPSADQEKIEDAYCKAYGYGKDTAIGIWDADFLEFVKKEG